MVAMLKLYLHLLVPKIVLFLDFDYHIFVILASKHLDVGYDCCQKISFNYDYAELFVSKFYCF